jgi:plasmid maintenance system antidote protein VapI
MTENEKGGAVDGFGTSEESWLNQQTQYALWHTEKRRKDLKVARLAA